MTDSTELTVHQGDGEAYQRPREMPAEAAPAGMGAIQVQSIDDVLRLADLFTRSQFFRDVRDASQAAVKILAGAEYGLSPLAAMRSIHVFDGKTELHYALIGALIKRHPRYDYRVIHCTPKGSEIAFFEAGDEIGRTTFSLEDARQAGLAGKQNWKKYSEDMCFGRAMTRGARRYCPDVFSGPIYAHGEIQPGAFDVTPEPAPTPEPEPKPPQLSPKLEKTLQRIHDGIVRCPGAEYDDKLHELEQMVEAWPDHARQAALDTIAAAEQEREERLAEEMGDPPDAGELSNDVPGEDLADGDENAAPFLRGESRSVPTN